MLSKMLHEAEAPSPSAAVNYIDRTIVRFKSLYQGNTRLSFIPEV